MIFGRFKSKISYLISFQDMAVSGPLLPHIYLEGTNNQT